MMPSFRSDKSVLRRKDLPHSIPLFHNVLKVIPNDHQMRMLSPEHSVRFSYLRYNEFATRAGPNEEALGGQVPRKGVAVKRESLLEMSGNP
jgi:hypothetical protein